MLIIGPDDQSGAVVVLKFKQHLRDRFAIRLEVITLNGVNKLVHGLVHFIKGNVLRKTDGEGIAELLIGNLFGFHGIVLEADLVQEAGKLRFRIGRIAGGYVVCGIFLRNVVDILECAAVDDSLSIVQKFKLNMLDGIIKFSGVGCIEHILLPHHFPGKGFFPGRPPGDRGRPERNGQSVGCRVVACIRNRAVHRKPL